MFKAAVEYTVGQLSARCGSNDRKNDSTDKVIIMRNSAEGSPSTTQNRSTIKQSLMTTDMSFNKIPVKTLPKKMSSKTLFKKPGSGQQYQDNNKDSTTKIVVQLKGDNYKEDSTQGIESKSRTTFMKESRQSFRGPLNQASI